MARPVTASRKTTRVPGASRFSRSLSAKRSGKWGSKNKKQVKKAPAARPTIAKKSGAKRFYPTDDVHRPLPSGRTTTQRVAAPRASITPGTVLILLAGRYQG
eukprot:EC719164.1.p2 GENE.EC719164.1~~EC719164.1.p2  ORF type:complete len:102 (+),score=18.71 EC719164.1:22-327(+)